MEERDVVIVGAGPAGLSAALYTKPDGWSTLMLESSWVGGQGAIAFTVKNYPGFPAGDGAILMENMQNQATSPPPAGFGVELKQEKVTGIDADKLVVNTEANQYQAKAIIMATGSTMQKLGVPGEDKFAGKGVTYYAKRDCASFKGKKVLVIGGGNTTIKSALVAKAEGKAAEIVLVHRRESLRAYPPMVKLLESNGIEIWYNTEVKELKGNGNLTSAMVVNNKTGEEKEVPVDWVVICVGTEPDTELAAKAGLKMAGNVIEIDDQMMTSKLGIFACGEITGSHRHLINAAADGASAGMAASEYLALEMVKNGQMFSGAKNGKYADEYEQMLKKL